MEFMKEQDGVNQLSLESLGLSSRTFHALRRVGINTISDALKMIELEKNTPRFYIPGFGKESYGELITKLLEKGFLLHDGTF